jgi:flavin-dependent dehydrogenase
MGSEQFDTDLVVVGAGPAGSAAAIAGAQRGLRVVLCERDRFIGERPGETLHPGIEPVLAQLGVAERLAPVVGARHLGVWIEWSGSRRFEAYGEDESGPWRGFQVRRSAFARLLIGRAKELGVEVRQPLAVKDVLFRAGRVCGVLTEAGPIAARMVVDASGIVRWLGRKLGLDSTPHSPRLFARYGYCVGSHPERDNAPALVGDASGWTWTAKVWPNTYQWTRLTFDGQEPSNGWVPSELKHLKQRGRVRGADVTWRLAARGAGSGWYSVGDAAATLDPTSSHGVLKAVVSGITAGHLIAASLQEKAPAEEAASAYHGWLSRSFAADAARLTSFYSDLDVTGFGFRTMPIYTRAR